LASELMDHYILECTKNNIEQSKNRFFVQGDPGAILAVDLSSHTKEEARATATALIEQLQAAGLGYHFPVLEDADSGRVWSLRKAGLGLLSNIPGDAKPVPVIEDTAVDVQDLPAYIREFNIILKKHGLFCVHYAHAGSGELHLRPIIDLKTIEGARLFRTIAEEIAVLVKKYQGSLSGEHGDGRLRGEFIRYMLGDENYTLLEDVKRSWDPQNIFNPGKIVQAPPMDTSLRYQAGQKTRQFDTALSFDTYHGILRAAELCNGSGDCRKTHISGGTMCPSYMATKNEKDTTRARANILREVLTHSTKKNPFDSHEIKEVMELCLSCKGCKAECPSNVDVGKMKAEFQHQYYKSNGIPLRTRLVANFSRLNGLASALPAAYSFTFNTPVVAPFVKNIIGFAKNRSMPPLHSTTLRQWYKKYKSANFEVKNPAPPRGKVYFFCDEFTNYNDVPAGQAALRLLTKLGWRVEMIEHDESGRTYLSKGLLDKAKKVAMNNVQAFSGLVSADAPLIGLEPSAILGFRDEYIDLMPDTMRDKALALSTHVYIIDEFLDREFERGEISKTAFSDEKKHILLHGHCHQKALSSVVFTKRMLSFPKNFTVQVIPSGCCGMAGSFGYEKEHFDVSMKIGELVLFPAIRRQPEAAIAAPGTSCRHQIKDGTGTIAQHPVEILWAAIAD
jgi:Fe-S oxidoreductase